MSNKVGSRIPREADLSVSVTSAASACLFTDVLLILRAGRQLAENKHCFKGNLI